MASEANQVFAGWVQLPQAARKVWIDTYGEHAAPFIWAHQSNLVPLPPGFDSLPPQELETWFTVYGPDAPTVWQHQSAQNAAESPGSSDTTTPSVASAPTAGGVAPAGTAGTPTGNAVNDPYGYLKFINSRPDYTQGGSNYLRYPLDRPGLFDTAGHNLQTGSGGPGDPNTGSEKQSPDQWVQGSRLFTSTTNLGDPAYEPFVKYGPLVNYLLRSDTPSGLGTPDMPDWVKAMIPDAIKAGAIKPTSRGQQFMQNYLGLGAGTAAPAAPAAGATNTAGRLDSTINLTSPSTSARADAVRPGTPGELDIPFLTPNTFGLKKFGQGGGRGGGQGGGYDENLARSLYRRWNGGTSDYGFDALPQDQKDALSNQAQQMWDAGTFGNGGSGVPIEDRYHNAASPAAPSVQPGTPQGGTPAAGTTPDVLDPAAMQALSQRMSQAAQAAVAYSQALGYVVQPTFQGADGTWTYEPMRDANGNQIPYGGAAQAAQIQQTAAQTQLLIAQATGRFQDASGNWQRTPAAILQEAQAAQIQNDANLAWARLTGVTGAGQNTLEKITTDAQIRQHDEELRQSEQRRQDALAVGNLDRAQRESEFARNLQGERDRLAEQARQFGVTSGQQQQSIDAQIRQHDTDLARLEQERQDAVRNGDENRRVTVEGQIRGIQAQRDLLAAQLGEQARQFNIGQSGVMDNGQLTLAARQQQFDQGVQASQINSNPRNFQQASLLAQGRGGLKGYAPNNALPLTFSSSGVNGATAAGTGATVGTNGIPLGTVGADDHYATVTTGTGRQVHLFSQPNTYANVPITAAFRALISGDATPQSGGLSQDGGYANIDQLRNAVDPNKFRTQDYAHQSRDEQAQTKSTLSLLGYSDNQAEDTLNSGLPQFSVPKAGSVGVPSMAGLI